MLIAMPGGMAAPKILSKILRLLEERGVPGALSDGGSDNFYNILLLF
jgi:hypothetical protein